MKIGNLEVSLYKANKKIKIEQDCDCENCRMGWENCGYEGECYDCGCLFDYEFDVPWWKCALPDWIKRICESHYKRKQERSWKKINEVK